MGKIRKISETLKLNWVSLFSLLHRFLSLPRLENDATLREDGANPQLYIQFLRDTVPSVQSGTKMDPHQWASLSQVLFCCLPSFLNFDYFLQFPLILPERIKPKDPQTVLTERGRRSKPGFKSFDSWHSNEPIPTEITSLLLIFPGYQSIYGPLLTSTEVLMNQTFKNNIHQEAVNYSITAPASFEWIHVPHFQHPPGTDLLQHGCSFRVWIYYPQICDWAATKSWFISILLSCQFWHSRRRGKEKSHQEGMSLLEGEEVNGESRPALAIKGVTHSGPHTFQILSWATSWIKCHLVWLTKALPCVWYSLIAGVKICGTSS